jgi:anti-sigma factor ChrR (cupin superfamily)
MNHDHPLGDPAELAALYAAGGMTGEEQAAFESHLAAGCATCDAALRDLDPVLVALGRSAEVVEPSPRTRDALLRRVAAEAPGRASPLRRHLAGGAAGDEGLVIRRAAGAAWEKTEVPGVSLRVLFVDPARDQFTALVRMEAGASYPRHVHKGPEECLVLEGELHVGEEVLRAGDYQRAAVGSQHAVQRTDQGCLLLITSSLSDEFA